MSQNTIMIYSAVALVLILIFIYNQIVKLKQKRLQAFSDIDVQLKVRYDLIPNLVEIVKGYASHEKALLENITNARTAVMNSKNIGERVKSENMLGMAVTGLFAVAENYPNLKASENFQKLQSELADIENKVAASRRFFNSATTEFNAAIQQFPAVLVARIFGFHSEDFFTVAENEKQKLQQPVEVKF